MRRTLSWTLLGAMVAGLACGGPPRLALEPVPRADDDRYDVPQPRQRERDDYYDLLDYTFFEQIGQAADLPRNVRKVIGKHKEALNATPLDEVQDSSWFTNRIGQREVSAAELRRGPNRPLGPDLDGTWTIVGAKTSGITPGFNIRDRRGDRYVIKFDPLSDPELATGAEAIGTRLFWAAGYNTPENYLVAFAPDQLQIDPKATVRLALGKRRPMTPDDLRLILSKVPKLPDGRVRCIASRLLAGTPLGPIPMLAVRRDDPNDVIQHEHRRELRGYKTYCAWLNHNDSREINSLDMYVEEGGRHFVKHYLIDFGATLGSASTGVNLRSEGYEYIFDVGQMAKSLLTLGLYKRPWEDLTFPSLRGIGRFESAHFDPGEWKPNYPCPPFENATARDEFWAAKAIMRFDDTLLATAVEEAQFSDPAAAAYMVRTLGERRDRIGRHAFARVNPLDEFEIVQAPSAATALAGKVMAGLLGGASGSPRALRFADLALRHGFVPPRQYEVTLYDGHDRQTAQFVTDAHDIPVEDAVAALAGAAPEDIASRLVRVRIRSSLERGWSPPVDVTLFLHPAGALRIAAIERHD